MTLVCAYSLTETLLGLKVWGAVGKNETRDERTHGIRLSTALRSELGPSRTLYLCAVAHPHAKSTKLMPRLEAARILSNAFKPNVGRLFRLLQFLYGNKN